MGAIKVICILLWDCLADVVIYFFDIFLMIQLAFSRILWRITAEQDKTKIKRQIIERISSLESSLERNLESQEDEHNELALKALRDYYQFIKEN